jgi:RND family efflux transporter MFP subunit
MKIENKHLRYLWTALAVLVAAVALLVFWRHYMVAPWTRDGRVRANVVKIAPEVSGTVAEVRVSDNQFVRKGDVLFVLDEARFQLALQEAGALVKLRKEDLEVKNEHASRRASLSDQAVAPDEKRTYSAEALMAQSAYDQAVAQYGTAELNKDRSVVRSPVNGYITNLNLRAGDYVNAGVNRLSIIDSDSFYILGYFEETKMSRIHEDNLARVDLMGFSNPLLGHVESISRGITDQNDRADEKGLATVDPVFTWVRLAQRIPVRIHIDQIPKDVRISAGMTCTIHIDEDSHFTAGNVTQ